MIIVHDKIEVKWNLEIDLLERGKRRRWHQKTHNIIVDTGRQFICEVVTPATLGSGTFTRTQDEVVRYVGFGIGGTRQNNPSASASPYSDAYPAGYGGTNDQTDVDTSVGFLERPVRVTDSPSNVWLQEIATPGTFPTATQTRFIAVFGETDINFGSFSSVPLSEIALYSSGADPSLPNGSSGTYPGTGGSTLAYDTFDTVNKTGLFSIEVRWTWRL